MRRTAVIKRIGSVVSALAVALVTMTACEQKQVELDDTIVLNYELPAEGDDIAVFSFLTGGETVSLRIRLFPEEAPKGVENFKALIEKGYYDGLDVFDQSSNKLFRTGSPTGDGKGGSTADGEELGFEYTDNLFNFTGAVGYVPISATRHNTSQIYFVAGPSVTDEVFKTLASNGDSAMYYAGNVKELYCQNGGSPNFDGSFTVIGQVFADDITLCKELSASTDEIVVAKAEITQYSPS